MMILTKLIKPIKPIEPIEPIQRFLIKPIEQKETFEPCLSSVAFKAKEGTLEPIKTFNSL
jgi:hypothetical protein